MTKPSDSRYVCTHCSQQVRRIGRQTFLERVVLPRLGFYPWECIDCRTVRYLHDDGHARPQQASLGSAPSAIVVGRR